MQQVREGRLFERRRLRVYVAGPISKGDTLRNIHRGVEWGAQLFKDGFAPYVPHFDAYMTFSAAAETPGESDDWKSLLEWDLEFVSVCDAVFRLQGYSKGADLECEVAESLDIPVFREDEFAPKGLVVGEVYSGYDRLKLFAEAERLTGVRK